MRSELSLAMLVGLGSVLGGLTVAYYANMPPGGTIVLLAAGAFLLASGVEAVRSR
jgi:zinc transport system permease protein